MGKKDDKIMTAEEVAEYLKIKRRTVYELARKRSIPGVKIGGQWRFKKDTVDKIFEQRVLVKK